MSDDLVKRLRFGSLTTMGAGRLNLEAADRIEELEGKLAEYKHVSSAIDTQWAEGQDQIAELKAKLAKAVEARDEALNQLDSANHSLEVLGKRVRTILDGRTEAEAKLEKAVGALDRIQNGSYGKNAAMARATLAELKGEKE